MKKLLTFAAATLLAIAANAAAVTWTVTNIQSSPDTTTAAGWLVQLYASTTTFSFDAAKEGSITALDSTASYASGTIFRTSSKYGSYDPRDSVSVYAVVYDAATVDAAKNYVVSSVTAKTIPDSGADITIAFGNMAGTTSTNLFKGATWTATPEPTSGLLLLLGVAGLALKRKRA